MNCSRHYTILVIEDDMAMLTKYLLELEASGYKVCGTHSAEDGLLMVESRKFDAILTDNVLPGISGLQSIREYAKYSDAPVLIMTSDYSAEIATDARLLGAACCLEKPLDYPRLKSELQRAIAQAGSPLHGR